MTGEIDGPDAIAAGLLAGFEISLYHWNLRTDELSWVGNDTQLMQTTGLRLISKGSAFADLREDGAERSAWAISARPGETCRFAFAVPTGPASVVWIEDQARRWDREGEPFVSGVLRRIAAPRLARPAAGRSVGEREGRAALAAFLAGAGTGEDRNYILFGIDNLRDLTRALGPDVTDELLAEVEARIAAAPPQRCQFARVGSARFGVAEVGSDAQAAALLARRIMEAVGRSEIMTSIGPVTVSVSAGICQTPAGEKTPADPFSNALLALDEARIGRVEGLRFARAGGSVPTLRERYMSGARLVMDAIAEGRMTIAFQPVVRADMVETPAFHECLARILDRDGSLVPAGSFMPAVEHLGLVRQVDRIVLGKALETLAAHPDQRLSVNLSPQSMHDSEWLAILEDGLRTHPDAGDRLILEVTESSAMLDPARTLAFMNRVRGFGCSFALDDFGAGYTSFKHFRDFRFDAVKIDGSFARGVAANRDNQILVATLVSIADHFSMFTVAEFVEEEADATWLAGMGIDFFQGYRYGRPVLAPAWLRGAEAAQRMTA